MGNGNYSKQILFFGGDPNKLFIGNSGHLHHNFEISDKVFCLVIYIDVVLSRQ